jgi:hypothetical protein
MDNRHRSGALGRSRAAHGSRRPDQIPPRAARLAIPGRATGRSRDALTLAAALATMLAWPLITAGSAQFVDSTLGYQLIQRGDGVQFSIWTHMPHVAIVARPVLAAALVLVALLPMPRPPVQDAREHAALTAALLTGAQLLLGYWFCSYLTWFYPLLIIVIIQARSDHEAALWPGGLKEQPGVQVICRDRSGAYAEGSLGEYRTSSR